MILGLQLCGLPEFRAGQLHSKEPDHAIVIAQANVNKEIREVTVVGRGEDYDKAAQNAAKNAITEVVGSFLDAEPLVIKKTIID